jgi:DNA-binding IclR family transcriptional regulator
MSGLERYTAVLRLFTAQKSVWTVQQMAEALGVPQSTAYRTVRDLLDENFLEAAGEARYRLGSVFIEFDRLLRLTDPLVRAGEGVLRELVTAAGVPCVGLLCRLYNDTVMCVADTAGGGTFRSSYERGRPMPLTQGATSKAILASLPARRLARLLEAVGAERSDTFRQELAAIRKHGVCITHSEIDADVLGIAAPVFPRAPGSLASLSLVLPMKQIDDALTQRLAEATIAGARRLEHLMAQDSPETPDHRDLAEELDRRRDEA